MVFGVGLGIIPIGEQADDLEAIRRTAAYQDRRGHGPFSLCLSGSEADGRAASAAISAASFGSMPDFGFGRCDGHHEMDDLRLEKSSGFVHLRRDSAVGPLRAAPI